MSLKSAIETPTTRKTSRKTTRSVVPVEGLPGSILFASALKTQARKPRGSAWQRRGAAQPVASPDFAAKLQSIAQGGLLSRLFSWFRQRVGTTSSKELRLAETVQLGEKRFVAIIHVEGRKFLIGGGADGVNLLKQLDETA